MNTESQNPWLQIPAEDYENHMSNEKVGQLQALNKIFKDILNEYSPESLCVFGCTTGNGFEHIDTKMTKSVVGIDINEEYLKILKERFGKDIPDMLLICSDLNDLDLPPDSFDLIHAALIFEYVDVKKIINKISNWLSDGGVLTVVLQMPDEKLSPVSETQYQSLKLLTPIINLVNPRSFLSIANKAGFKEIKKYEYDLNTGKRFYISCLANCGI